MSTASYTLNLYSTIKFQWEPLVERLLRRGRVGRMADPSASSIWRFRCVNNGHYSVEPSNNRHVWDPLFSGHFVLF